ncbi:hypothetical protein D3C80_333880 [compost metagenome]
MTFGLGGILIDHAIVYHHAIIGMSGVARDKTIQNVAQNGVWISFMRIAPTTRSGGQKRYRIACIDVEHIDFAKPAFIRTPAINDQGAGQTCLASIGTPWTEQQALHASTEYIGIIGQCAKGQFHAAPAAPLAGATGIRTQAVVQDFNAELGFDRFNGIVGEIGDAAVSTVNAIATKTCAGATDHRFDDLYATPAFAIWFRHDNGNDCAG